MKKSLLVVCTILFAGIATAQLPQPTDYLKPEFHKGRREALRALMPPNSVAVFFASPVRNFSNDVDYRYHANPDLYYFSGYTEPDGFLLVFKDMQTAGSSTPYNELLFVRKRDSLYETWTGKRLGADGAKKKLGFAVAFEGGAFADFPLDLKKFSQIIYGGVKDLSASDNSEDGIGELVKLFHEKAGMTDYDESFHTAVNGIAGRPILAGDKYRKRIIDRIKTYSIKNPLLVKDPVYTALVSAEDSLSMIAVFDQLQKARISSLLYDRFTSQLRQIKTPEEMVLLRKAIDISSLAHVEAMKAVKPSMSERELQGVQEFIHKKLGAEDVGYGSIVGAGENGCTLHYETNTATAVGNDMVLMDVGAEYHGYTADVTRTFPTNGKFSREQKLVYDIVYEAQEAVFRICREGTPFSTIEDTAAAVLARGLLKLGIIKDAEEVYTYYPHGCSHFLGLDVHDKGEYLTLKENMVITVEPGIYIPPNSACDKKWWNIAVRIEDDVRIDKKTMELLTHLAPRKTQDIEKVMTEKSFTDGLIISLPTPKKGF